jgi:diguanylate cyclase (GGDEF)-like protein/putative nucleotidyltransferase with HDIG domain
MAAMGLVSFQLFHGSVYPYLAILLSLVLLLIYSRRERIERENKNVELQWFSELHLFGKALAESPGPKQMADLTVQRILEMFGSGGCYILVQTNGSEAMSQVCAQGLSAQAVELLSGDPIRSYLTSCGERWGNLLIFPDLSRPSLEFAWQRDALFHELRALCVREGLRTLVVVGLQVRESSYGALLMGSSKPRSFRPNELRLLLAMGNQLGVAVENWSLHRAAERHNQELRLLHRVSELLRAKFDLESQVEILRQELQGVLGTTNFSLALQDSPEGPLKTVVPFQPVTAEVLPGVPEVDGLADFVCQGRRPLLVTEDLPAKARRLGIQSVDGRLRTWCGVPIHFSDGALGVLAVADFERENAINQEQFELMQVLADEATGAVESARLFQKERRRASHLTLLNELTRKAASDLDPKELLSNICREVRNAFDRDFARIEVADPQKNELVVEAEAGYGAELLGRRVHYGEGLSGAAAISREPVLANSVLRDLRYVALRPGVRSALSLPLRYRDDLLGVLSLESMREYSFSQQDVLTLQSLANQLAINLHNARAYQLALDQAITDGLTGLKTHRFFREALDGEWRRSARSGRPFSVIMMDLDRFKQVNDQGGHLEGDRVLAAVATLLDSRSRQSNVVARYGGDEFAILMPETNTEQAQTLAERLRSALQADHFLHAHHVTASIGVACFPDHGPTPQDILSVADSGMYLAKHCEGNCVKVASLSIAAEDGENDQGLLDAYLGVAVKRMFSNGNEALCNHYRHRFEQMKPLWDTITALAFAVEAKDPYTRRHSAEVSSWAAKIALQVGLSQAEIEDIKLAGIVHDIGKIHVPEEVLCKPSLLTPKEFDLVKSHAAWGAKILEPLKESGIERIVRYHHEALDGQGYPDGLKGEQIPIGARIITVADAFQAMVRERRYRPARSVEEALAELRRCRGTQFDPLVVDALVQLIESCGGPQTPDVVESLLI